MWQNFSLSSYYDRNTKLQLSDKIISTHTSAIFKVLLSKQIQNNSVFCCCCCFFFHTVLYKKESKERGKNHARICSYRVVQTPLIIESLHDAYPLIRSHDFVQPLGFLFVWRATEKNNNKTLELLFYFTERFKISSECVLILGYYHSVVIWYCDMN